jgi:hypothetical protein
MQHDTSPKGWRLPPMAIRDPSSLVLWVLMGLAIVSLAFTTRDASDPSQTSAALNPVSSQTAL